MASRYNITIEQGANWSLVVTWKDSVGALVNLTGYTARMQVRATVPDPTVIVELRTDNGHISLGGAAGTITMTLDAATTDAIVTNGAPIYGVYDLEIVSGSGLVTRLIEGAATISPQVTR